MLLYPIIITIRFLQQSSMFLTMTAQKALNAFTLTARHIITVRIRKNAAINETVVAAVFRLQKDNSFDSGSFDFDYQFDLFSADIVVGTVASELLGSLPFVPKPYIAGSHLDYVARAIGLRAPPIC